MSVAQGSSSLPFVYVTTPGVTSLLVGFFYAGCVYPPIAPKRAFSSEHKSLSAALLILWATIWLVLVASVSM
jgi:hypothetical protein